MAGGPLSLGFPSGRSCRHPGIPLACQHLPQTPSARPQSRLLYTLLRACLPRNAIFKRWRLALFSCLEQLADDPADSLQGGELLLLLHMQGFVGKEVLLGQHLLACGADAAVEVGAQVCLPGALPVLPGSTNGGSGGAQPGLQVIVSGKQFLLLGRVRQQHKELVEDLLEVLAQQLLATLVILSCRNQTLGLERREGDWTVRKQEEAGKTAFMQMMSGAETKKLSPPPRAFIKMY